MKYFGPVIFQLLGEKQANNKMEECIKKIKNMLDNYQEFKRICSATNAH